MVPLQKIISFQISLGQLQKLSPFQTGERTKFPFKNLTNEKLRARFPFLSWLTSSFHVPKSNPLPEEIWLHQWSCFNLA